MGNQKEEGRRNGLYSRKKQGGLGYGISTGV